uniref:Uncharacterized protein n=1 Tax=Oryza meridionalis TaxID=40149 RepID=A0A0E0EKH3_9ORYZ
MAAISRTVHNVEAEPHDHVKRMPKPAPHGKVIKIQVDDADPAKLVLLGGDLGEEEAKSILEVLKKNIDIFDRPHHAPSGSQTGRQAKETEAAEDVRRLPKRSKS